MNKVDPQGFEPRQTEPKSGVLPLHHGSLFLTGANLYDLNLSTKYISNFFLKKTQNTEYQNYYLIHFL